MFGGNKVHPDIANSSAEDNTLSSSTSIQISKDLGDVNSANESESEIESKQTTNTESESGIENHENKSEPTNAAADSNSVCVCFYRIGTIHLA